MQNISPIRIFQRMIGQQKITAPGLANFTACYLVNLDRTLEKFYANKHQACEGFGYMYMYM